MGNPHSGCAANSDATPARNRGGWVLLRFVGVASVMASIDISLLWCLSEPLSMALLPARLISYGSALVAGFLLNSRFTFGHRDVALSFKTQLARFVSVHAVGGALNVAVFMGTVAAWQWWQGPEQVAFLVALLGVFLGGILGMSFNFFLSHRLVFPHQ